jgi:hypothetical protein
MKISNFLLIFFLATFLSKGQFDFDGQLTLQGNTVLNNEKFFFLGLRYLPELNYKFNLDSLKSLTFQSSGNLTSSKVFNERDENNLNIDFSPYRIWVRYLHKRSEYRVGLQKIDFGSAMILRPLQWFNEIDPRDPLRLTNGVYGLLFRHYFKDNTNIWLWGLYGNNKKRGLDILPSYDKNPEFGGRFQTIVAKGEIAFTYHFREATKDLQTIINKFNQNPESRFGFDAKWDLGIGLWIESTYIKRKKDIGSYTQQNLLTFGSDYTFGIGNGINLIVEHLLISYGNKNIFRQERNNFSAISGSYPLTFSSTLNALFYHQWNTNNNTFTLNYQNQFNRLKGYFVAYYNPKNSGGIQQNEIINTFAGPGIQLLLVYNH